MKCSNCNYEIKDSAYFCPFCGHLVRDNVVKNKELIQEYENKVKNTISQIDKTVHGKIEWDPVVDKYVAILERLKTICELPEFEENRSSNFINRINLFINRCQKPEFHIAFVGTIKAGKSTLINALLGKNYASTSVTPETAVLTKFRHCAKTNYVAVKFYSSEEWKILWDSVSNSADVFRNEYQALNGEGEKDKWLDHEDYKIELEDGLEEEIERWTSSKKVEHYFVKEVEIGLKDFQMPEEVIFVDTPGLDDAVKYRSKVTRDYIDRANAVFACVKSDALTGPELNTLYRIFTNTSYNPEKVFVIGTQWDSLNNPIPDWNKQKEEWIKYLSRPEAFGSKELAEKNIEYTAAYVNNLARDYANLNEDEQWSLSSIGFKFRIRPDDIEMKLDELIELSNIEKINQKIKDNIVNKYKVYLYKDIEQSYLDLKRDIKNHFIEIKKTQEEVIATSSKDIEQIREEYEKAQEEIKQVTAYRLQLAKMLKLVKEDTNKRIKELTSQLEKLV